MYFTEFIFLPDTENLREKNPINPGDELNYYKGKKELFYLINFYEIKEKTYYISSYGRIFSLNNNKEMNPSICTDKNGKSYKRLCLRLKDGGNKMFSIHRLVAMAFIPRELQDFKEVRDTVDHKDNIGVNNIMWNLRWVTNQENTLYYHRGQKQGNVRGILKQPITYVQKDVKERNKALGEKVGMSRFTDNQVHIMCKCLEQDMAYDDCLIAAGLEPNDHNKNVLCNIKAGRRWQHISSQYNIDKSMRFQNDLSSYVIPVCKLLEKRDMNIKQIVQHLQIPGSYDSARMFVSGIKNKKTYLDISKDYKF